MTTVWVRTTEGSLLPLAAGVYGREKGFQEFLADHPEVLASTVSPEGGPWLLVCRELSIRFEEDAEHPTWSLDHLFIDSEGTPTLVEVKRSSDPRARREVVAQMLDYVSSFRRNWTSESLQARRVESARRDGRDPDQELDNYLAESGFDDEAALWSEVATRIEANRLRLLFVADRLPAPLVRIIEYLNEQLRTTEVLGVEIVPHGAADAGVVAYVPVLRGQTSAVPRNKQVATRRSRDEFDQMLSQHHGPRIAEGVAQFTNSVEDLGGQITIGTDVRSPTLYTNFVSKVTARRYWPLGIKSRAGKVAVQLRWLAKHPAFEDEDRRDELLARISTATGVEVSGRLDGFPSFEAELLGDEGVRQRLLDVMRWTIEVSDAQAGPAVVTAE